MHGCHPMTEKVVNYHPVLGPWGIVLYIASVKQSVGIVVACPSLVDLLPTFYQGGHLLSSMTFTLY